MTKPYFGKVVPLNEEDALTIAKRTEYNYRDASGRISYQIVRDDLIGGDKTFWQRHPIGNGKWVNSIKGLARIPYNLPAVKYTIHRGGIVFIVEGEKCADRLNQELLKDRVNGVATCNNGGAGQWGTEQAQYLTGAKVCLLPDNDDIGREHMDKVARSLKGIPESIK